MWAIGSFFENTQSVSKIITLTLLKNNKYLRGLQDYNRECNCVYKNPCCNISLILRILLCIICDLTHSILSRYVIYYYFLYKFCNYFIFSLDKGVKKE